MPPSYGSQGYWDKRFTSEPEPFEWLEAPHVLDPFLHDAQGKANDPGSELLHIGCGTSNLSLHLRTIFKGPQRIHNVDYSSIAIELGQKREKELLESILGKSSSENGQFFTPPKSPSENEPSQRSHSPTNLMRWSTTDLLSPTFLQTLKASSYTIILDKSTSDSIACCEDIEIHLPYHITIPSSSTSTSTTDSLASTPPPSPYPMHPIHILALHLALLTKTGGRWISLSYSSDRFPFIDGLYSSRPHLDGFPDTGTLWKLVEKREVVDRHKDVEMRKVEKEGRTMYRPKVVHWVYVMERTDVGLEVRGGHI